MATEKPVYHHYGPEFSQHVIDLALSYKVEMVYWDSGCTIVDLSRTIKARSIQEISRGHHQDIRNMMFDKATRIE